MKQRNSLNHEFWRDELAYIQSVNVRDPGPGYNHSPACFASYCDMQANSAEREGFKDMANQIRGIAVAAVALDEPPVSDGKTEGSSRPSEELPGARIAALELEVGVLQRMVDINLRRISYLKEQRNDLASRLDALLVERANGRRAEQ